MDKNSYETYEYLPNAENETNQFFVVQDDGSFLSVNRQIQYVTEVQDVKEVLESVEPCTVYDVSSQQFYIDVDNTAELISVSDEFILSDGENNIFSNNYLLPVTNSTDQQIEQQGAADQHEELETQIETAVDGQSPRQINSCTEITLSNEQYRTLEQKGWILLETNEKVFVLDTLGLHDITSNYKLIQKLKVEDGSINENIQPEYESLSNQEDKIESIIDEDGIKLNKEIIQDHELLSNNVEREKPAVVTNSVAEPQEIILLQNEAVSLSSLNSESSKSTTGNTFKVKTDIVFSDVPEKILLGETANGKKLFAKIKKLNNNNVITAPEIPPRSDQKQVHRKQKSASNHENTKQVPLGNTTLNESQFESLIRLAIQNNSEAKCSADDVASADSVVTQLLKVPAFRPSVLDQNLIITKEVSVEDHTGTLRDGGLPSLVTGRITALDEDRYCFVHLPGMLKQLINKSGSDLPPVKKESSQSENKNISDGNVLHVHVTEIKRADNVLRVSITLNKRQLPNDSNATLDCKRKQSNMVYGCSACAAVFQTENELQEHQEKQCMDVDDGLTIDIEKKGYTMKLKGKRKIYFCNQCQLKFTKLFNCLKHLKTHFNCVEESDDNNSLKSESKENQKNGIYKCKMCSSTYLHSSTLTKHIVSKHIKVRSN
ncbi:unnamed protein product [Parnassius apollo]|uniref:(apollo) hypothetical protein n=1 Tax=Parnassius apollo TaxID=110799 RepID=A0A8S3WG30_PARAO|nr:unnamed protein product [Parnassius apollo]